MGIQELKTEVLILGSGGAGLMAALHAPDEYPDVKIVLATKGLLAKSGCTRMVQGGYNAVLDPRDSLKSHFADTMQGGAFLNDEELAWALVNDAPAVVAELETRIGVFFYRRADGMLHQKPMAGQSFARTVHRGDLTGIEIVSRLADHVMRRPGTTILEETRLLDLVLDRRGDRIGGALLLDIRTGELLLVRCLAVVLATGGAAPLYKIASASLEKSGDGLAAAFRLGVDLMDMEMTQFHPTGLLAGNSKLNGSVLAEELRTHGGRLFNSLGERFMERYEPTMLESGTRDTISRAAYLEIMAGRTTPRGGVWLDMSHLGPEVIRSKFPGMVDRVQLIGIDLTRQPVEVAPTSHFTMGGVVIDVDGRSHLEGLFAAGEDSAGVHGANRLGGNGVAESTVFGRRAGRAAGAYAARAAAIEPASPMVSDLARAATRCWASKPGERHPAHLLKELKEMMWERAGVVRSEPLLISGLEQLARLRTQAEQAAVTGSRAYNLTWNDALNLRNLIDVGTMVAQAALLRRESRGAHYRSDFPERDDRDWLANIVVRRDQSGDVKLSRRPVRRLQSDRDGVAGLGGR